ncbi:hypothetical protein HHK36_019258 [Tetracentron sinense]|uniref:Uncharacterized protein n=1 Tax=Tetracentron sinense TaxID=13715 RepID=A0A834YVX6_TETSI|nr:hypothetical protein HHK36_019258 [Tetracentron sinense]
MSKFLEFQHGLPEIQLPPIEVKTRKSLDVDDEDDGRIQLTTSNDECRTPKSDEQSIPVIRNCPPAPRKRRPVVLCKRKLSELQFFEITGRTEVDSFFQSNFELPYITSRIVKRQRNGV